jgi:hypothetical protein
LGYFLFKDPTELDLVHQEAMVQVVVLLLREGGLGAPLQEAQAQDQTAHSLVHLGQGKFEKCLLYYQNALLGEKKYWFCGLKFIYDTTLQLRS